MNYYAGCGGVPLWVITASSLHSNLEAGEKNRGAQTIIFVVGKTAFMGMVHTCTKWTLGAMLARTELMEQTLTQPVSRSICGQPHTC